MMNMDSKAVPFVFDGVCQHIPQKAIGSILELSSIRRISFTTPPDRCAALVEQAKGLYSVFLGAPDSLKILEFISMHLSDVPEENDVVHDLLAYLAEQMIDMNKNNIECSIFLICVFL